MMGLEDESEQFSLRWNNFHSNLTAGFHDLLEEEDLVDVTLACDGQFVQAHKIVLSVCSPYFKTLFKANPCKHPIVILKDVGHKELQAILQFMYRGEVNVRQDDLTSFLKTAEMLKIKGLTGDNDKPERSSPKQQQQQRRPAPEERPERPKPVQPKEEPPPPIPQQHSQPPSPAVPYKRMRTEPPPRPPTPPSPDTNDDDIEFLEVTKPKIEPPDYSQDEYSSEGPSKVMSDDQASNHLSTESAGHSGQTSDTIVPSMSMISSQLQITPVEQDTIDSKASLSLPHSSSLEPSVSLQSPMSKEGIPGMFASVSGLSQDSNSQDGSQGSRYSQANLFKEDTELFDSKVLVSRPECSASFSTMPPFVLGMSTMYFPESPSNGKHFPVRIQQENMKTRNPRRYCRYCNKGHWERRKKGDFSRTMTYYMCALCDVPLCFGNCFEKWHIEQEVLRNSKEVLRLNETHSVEINM